ncbi:hypothetical protein HD554DRAFT_822 [Boletus coccyginus]|nr:hypothetical protein HD554DRAFT_822 [Boletus coccyginus]
MGVQMHFPTAGSTVPKHVHPDHVVQVVHTSRKKIILYFLPTMSILPLLVDVVMVPHSHIMVVMTWHCSNGSGWWWLLSLWGWGCCQAVAVNVRLVLVTLVLHGDDLWWW